MKKVNPKKMFSQNFLIDENILNKIANAINVNNRNIIEIGPGMGALTKYLVNKAKKVIAFEIDFNLIEILNEKFKNYKNIEIINHDFLKVDLSKYIDNYVIVANIPYNISTDILFNIFKNYLQFDEVVLLVQKEYGKRVVAKINEKEYGKLSITTKIFYDSKILFDVPNSAFLPKPKITSSVIYLKRNQNQIDECKKWEFSLFIKNCFAMKRKTLINNLKKINVDLNDINNFWKLHNISKNIRPEEIEIDIYWELYKFLYT